MKWREMMQPTRHFAHSLLLGLAALLAPGESHAAVVIDTAPPTVVSGHCIKAKTTGTMLNTVHSFQRNGHLDEISAKGVLSIEYEVSAAGELRTKDPRDVRHDLNIISNEHEWIHELYVGEYENDLILVGEIRGSAGGGFAVRWTRTGPTRKWLAEIPAFELRPSLMHERDLYVLGMRFLCKLDLATGWFRWRHEGLYPENEAFKRFARAYAEGVNMVFVGSGADRDNEIVVHATSGRIVEIRTSSPPSSKTRPAADTAPPWGSPAGRGWLKHGAMNGCPSDRGFVAGRPLSRRDSHWQPPVSTRGGAVALRLPRL